MKEEIFKEKRKNQLRDWMIGNRLCLEVEWKEGNCQDKKAGLREVEKIHIIDAKWDDDENDDELLLVVEGEKSSRSIPITKIFELFYNGYIEDEFNDCIARCKLISEEE